MQSNLILAHILCTIFASVFLDLMLKEACSTVHPTFGRRIRPETKAVQHTFDAHIFDFSSLLLHGAHSSIDHLHRGNGIVRALYHERRRITAPEKQIQRSVLIGLRLMAAVLAFKPITLSIISCRVAALRAML